MQSTTAATRPKFISLTEFVDPAEERRTKPTKRGVAVSSLLQDCQEFEATGSPEQRQRFRLPKYMLHGIDAVRLSLRKKKPRQDVVLFFLAEGVARLQTLPAVETIRAARESVLIAGSRDADWFDEFKFTVDVHHQGTKDFNARNIDDEVSSRLAMLADCLGLSMNTVAAIAVAAVLMDTPVQYAGWAEEQVGEFLAELHRREKEARRLGAEAARNRRKSAPRRTFADLVRLTLTPSS